MEKKEETKFIERPYLYIGLAILVTLLFIPGWINAGQLIGTYTLLFFLWVLIEPSKRNTLLGILKELRAYKKGLFGLGLLIIIAIMAVVGPFFVHRSTHKPLSAPQWAGELTDPSYYPDFYQFKATNLQDNLNNDLSVNVTYSGKQFFKVNYSLVDNAYKGGDALRISITDNLNVPYTSYADVFSEVEINVYWTTTWNHKFMPRIVENGFFLKTMFLGNLTAQDYFETDSIYIFKDFSMYIKLHNMTGQEFLNYLEENNIAYAYGDPRYGVKLGFPMSANVLNWTKYHRDVHEGDGYKLALFKDGNKIDVQLVIRVAFNQLTALDYEASEFNNMRKNGSIVLDIAQPYMFIWSNYYGLMGTDHRGLDLLYRIIRGAAISLIIGITVSVVSAILGAVIGIFSGYYGGRVDELLMRIIDFIMSIPHLPLLIVLVIIFDSMGVNRVYSIFFLLTIFGWPGISRVIRSQVLSLKTRPFIDAAKASGASNRYIMFRHLLPNVIPLIMIYIMTGAPLAILSEASLSFLGLGPTGDWDSWGTILRDASNIVIFQAGTPGQASKIVWWFIFFPGLFLMLIGIAFMFLGYTLEEIYNPKRRGL
ncbi:MAG: ABC transporter permease [Candidatus Njordarchaeia archaeon]